MVANAILGSFMPIGAEYRAHIPLDQLLQSVAQQLGNSLPALLPSSSGANAGAPESNLGMVCLLDDVLKPDSLACAPPASPAFDPGS